MGNYLKRERLKLILLYLVFKIFSHKILNFLQKYCKKMKLFIYTLIIIFITWTELL